MTQSGRAGIADEPRVVDDEPARDRAAAALVSRGRASLLSLPEHTYSGEMRPADVGIGRLFEQIREAVIVAEVDTGHIVLWNPGAERIFGYAAAEVLHHSIEELIVPDGLRHQYAASLTRYRRTGWGTIIDASEATHEPVELPAWTKSGTQIVVEVSLTRIEDAPTPGTFVMAVLRDVTARKRAEADRAELAREQAARAAAEAALRERDQVLAMVSHDLRTPLATIRGQAQLLHRQAERTGALDLERTLKGLDVIETATVKMAAWIDELLDATRLEAGRPLELRRAPTDLVALAWLAAAEHQRATERHRLCVETCEPQLIGFWDSVRLERVLDNLLANAVKYSPAGGEVTISVARDEAATGAWAVLRVRDPGVGIPAADQRHIFERFRRGANVVGRIDGTGIGLAGAAQIVQQHRGSISVESREGEGSTFTVRLPLDVPR